MSLYSLVSSSCWMLHADSTFSCTQTHANNQTPSAYLNVFFLLSSYIIILYYQYIKYKCVLLLCRPPDRRRRDVFGFPNSTFLHEGSGWNSSLGGWDNSTEGIPPIREYPFSEDKVAAESFEISLLRPFTVYRIDLHACNEVMGRCSAGAFVFARTKPAGRSATRTHARTPSEAALFPQRLKPALFFRSGGGRHPREGGV